MIKVCRFNYNVVKKRRGCLDPRDIRSDVSTIENFQRRVNCAINLVILEQENRNVNFLFHYLKSKGIR